MWSRSRSIYPHTYTHKHILLVQFLLRTPVNKVRIHQLTTICSLFLVHTLQFCYSLSLLFRDSPECSSITSNYCISLKHLPNGYKSWRVSWPKGLFGIALWTYPNPLYHQAQFLLMWSCQLFLGPDGRHLLKGTGLSVAKRNQIHLRLACVYSPP